MKTLARLLTLTLLAGCAGPAPVLRYSAPDGVSDEWMQRDLAACVEEAGIERLAADRVRLQQQCMMDRGYRLEELTPIDSEAVTGQP
ncbi:MAG TPA: hypothetical protein VFV27_08035 [Nevskiaceae bacterium]|nr:hypothetical protein [Nevskiaceae bacterium]